ncbi:MAG: hypothetical protein AB8H80_10130 [Planctomycetota bacterium]
MNGTPSPDPTPDRDAAAAKAPVAPGNESLHGHSTETATTDLSSLDTQPPSPPVNAEQTMDPPAGPAWPTWQRIVFRFLLIYYVLHAFPRPLSNLLQTVGGILGLFVAPSAAGEAPQGWLVSGPMTWLGAAMRGLYSVTEGRQGLTTWLSENGLSPYEVIHQRTGSGDTAHGITLLLAHAVAAALLAGIWSALRRRPCGYPGLGRWLHLLVRFDLAFSLLSYGAAKLYGSQFGELSLTRLTQEIGDTWPMSMVGTFMQSYPAYEVLGGLAEVLAGLLLFHRRTALMGALVALVVMGNVCALNWLCGVPVKLFSAHLWLFALFLLAPWRYSLGALLLQNRPSQPVDMRVPAWRLLRWPLIVGGWCWVLASILLVHLGGVGPKPWLKGREKSELYGAWMVERMLVDGVEVPTNDASRWRLLAIDIGNRTWTRDANGNKLQFEFVLDPDAKTAQVKPRSAGPSAVAVPWTIVQGTKTVPCDPPLLLHAKDRGKKVPAERRTLKLTGAWGEKQLELLVVEKRFRLQTGFRLRQELPDFW